MDEREGRQLGFPERVVGKPKTRPRFKRILGLSILVVPFAIPFAIYGGRKITDEIRDSLSNTSAPSLSREYDLEDLESYYGFSEASPEEEVNTRLVEDYISARRAFTDFYNYQLITDNTPQTLATIQDERWQLIVNAANLVGKIGYAQVEVIQNEGSVRYNDLLFRRGDPFEEYLADQLFLQAILSEKPSATYTERAKSRQKVEDLVWLARQDLPITFEQEFVTLFADDSLVLTSRFYQRVISSGYPIPQSIVFKRFAEGDPGAGWYDEDTDSIYLTEKAGQNSIVHEGSHHQANQNPNFGREKFNQIFQLPSGEINLSLLKNESLVSDYPLTKADIDDQLKEAYASTLDTYFSDGEGFRFRLKELEIQNHPSSEILKAQFDFARAFYGGEEFIELGEPFRPKLFSIFTISDPDPRPGAGILLRPQPNLSKDPSYPVVVDLEQILIMDGPVEYLDPSTGEVKKLWFVEKGQLDDQQGVFNGTGVSGWISQEWFGYDLTPIRYPVPQLQ